MKKTAALASALRSSGARLPAAAPVSANDAPPAAVTETATAPAPTPARVQPSRRGTKPITVHFPEEVRRQLKTLADEQGRNVDDVVAEAFNLVFAKYRKAEIAPRRSQQGN